MNYANLNCINHSCIYIHLESAVYNCARCLVYSKCSGLCELKMPCNNAAFPQSCNGLPATDLDQSSPFIKKRRFRESALFLVRGKASLEPRSLEFGSSACSIVVYGLLKWPL